MRKVFLPLELVSLSFLCMLYLALLEQRAVAGLASRHPVFSDISPHTGFSVAVPTEVALQSHLRKKFWLSMVVKHCYQSLHLWYVPCVLVPSITVIVFMAL